MSTQLQQAVKGIVTPELKEVAGKEGVDADWLRREVANGRVVIPKNINRQFPARGIGNGLSTKINANIGTSEAHCNFPEELEKMKISVDYGADAVMDLSTGGDLHQILKNILKESPVMIGTVPIYAVATRLMREGGKIEQIDPEALFGEIEDQAKAGVDFMTLHCGVTRTSVSFLENDERVCGIVSRGGAILKRWITLNDTENPLYEHYNRVLDICEQYDVTISLGDGIRPGCGADATDRGQVAELLIIGQLVDRARERGVQVIVEGPGHMPFDQIEMNMKLMKKICHDAPLYVLGPLTTDSAPGYDHITGAIGGTAAAVYGADFLCYVTPAEHLCLPDANDVKLGVIASRIAAQSADIVKNTGNARKRDYAISKARRDLDWEAIFLNAIDPETAKARKDASQSSTEDYCSMCGNLCAVKTDKGLELKK